MKGVHLLPRSCFVAICACAAVVSAQEFRATVTGHVTDSSGAAMPKVTVQVTNLGTNESSTAVTNNQGIYSVPFLKPGNYRLTAEAAGFKKYVKDNIVLNVGDVAGIDIGDRKITRLN